jgi:hypothetical protein
MSRYVKMLLCLMFGVASVPALAAAPLVPIASFLNHWDHHWYIWLPGDPLYEAVEVMATERGSDSAPLVWVFFTERDGPKRQIHYYNDARIAAAAGGQSRDIAFKMTTTEGGARDVSVAFEDDKSQPVAIDVYMSPEARLGTRNAGLTNQIGHSGDRFLLLFFREKAVAADAWSVAIAGVNVAIPQPGQNHPAPFPAVYSSNIYVGGFPFGDWRIGFGEGGEAGIVRFRPTTIPGSFQTILSDSSRIELVAAADGALQIYRNYDSGGGHVLEISFDPPLPAADRLENGVDSACRISLDGFHDLLIGAVHAARHDGSVTLDWRFDTPEWTRVHPLRSTMLLKDGVAGNLALRPMSSD